MELGFLTLKRKIGLAVIGIFVLLNIFAWRQVVAIASPHYVTVDVLDVGQGDSIFIETPEMRHILIDGGPGSAVLSKLQNLLPFWDRTLDVVVLTHPDLDHIGGLLAVLQKYHVSYIVWTGIVRDGQAYQEWLLLLEKQKQQGAIIIEAGPGLKIVSGKMVLETIHPQSHLAGQFFGTKGNDTSIVQRLIYGKRSFLFTGDISEVQEQEILEEGVNISSDVLKVAHHGSKYSSSQEFINAADPELAVISVGGRNTYGHPTQEVLQRLQKFDITTLRTDQQGDVVMITDGEYIQVK